MDMNKWDSRFIDLAKHISTWSKDPSTKCGAVIVDSFNRVVSMGYNGFATNVMDTDKRYNDREQKYKFVVHAEKNAIIFSKRDLTNCTIYVYPMPPCSQCAASIIQSGITHVVAIKADKDQEQRWKDDFNITKIMFDESNVKYIEMTI